MSEQRPGMFASLKVRDFALLWSGQGVSAIGDGIFSVALVLETLHVDDHPIALAYVIAARAVPSIVFSLLGGVMVDRLPRRFIMLVADVVRGLAVAVIAFLITVNHVDLLALVLMAAVSGMADSASHPLPFFCRCSSVTFCAPAPSRSGSSSPPAALPALRPLS